MDARGPQRLVGVDVADAARDRLVEQHALDPRRRARETSPEARVVERRVERVAGDVGDLRGDAGKRRTAAAGGGVGGVDEVVERKRAERPLVGEHHRQRPVHRMLELDADPLVPLLGRTGHAQQHLPAHAQVGHDRFVRTQRHPQELAPTDGAHDPTPGQFGLEVLRRAGVPRERAGVADVDRRDERTRHRGFETGADDLDLGQLRHGRRARATPRGRRPSPPASCSSRSPGSRHRPPSRSP